MHIRIFFDCCMQRFSRIREVSIPCMMCAHDACRAIRPGFIKLASSSCRASLSHKGSHDEKNNFLFSNPDIRKEGNTIHQISAKISIPDIYIHKVIRSKLVTWSNCCQQSPDSIQTSNPAAIANSKHSSQLFTSGTKPRVWSCEMQLAARVPNTQTATQDKGDVNFRNFPGLHVFIHLS